MSQSESINELSTALAKAQGEITCAIKDSLNPHFKSRYADLSSVWNACRSPLSKNGLAVIQTMDAKDDGKIILITTLTHSSGQYIRSYLPVIMEKQNVQSLGSCLTYLRRYSLASIVGVAPDEEDGESAVDRNKKAEPVLEFPKPADIFEINEILSKCSLGYTEKIFDFITQHGFKTLDKVPLTTFNVIKNKALYHLSSKKTDSEDHASE